MNTANTSIIYDLKFIVTYSFALEGFTIVFVSPCNKLIEWVIPHGYVISIDAYMLGGDSRKFLNLIVHPSIVRVSPT